jgi:hypothetical protein
MNSPVVCPPDYVNNCVPTLPIRQQRSSHAIRWLFLGIPVGFRHEANASKQQQARHRKEHDKAEEVRHDVHKHPVCPHHGIHTPTIPRFRLPHHGPCVAESPTMVTFAHGSPLFVSRNQAADQTGIAFNFLPPENPSRESWWQSPEVCLGTLKT